MTDTHYKDIINKLPSLTSTELVSLEGRLKALKSITPISSDSGSEPDDWLIAGIVRYANDTGLTDMIPAGARFAVRTRRQFQGYVDKSTRIRQMFETHIPNMTRAEKATLGQLLARLLAERLQEWRPVTFDALIYNVGDMQAAFEQAFPGYIKSRLGHVALRGLRPMKDVTPREK